MDNLKFEIWKIKLEIWVGKVGNIWKFGQQKIWKKKFGNDLEILETFEMLDKFQKFGKFWKF